MRAALNASFGLLLALLLGGAWLLGVAAPLGVLAASGTVSASQTLDKLATTPLWSWGHVPALLAVTLGWSAAITLGSALIGVPMGLCLARTGSGRISATWSSLCVAVLCMPPYLLYWVWGLLRLPGSPLGEWARVDPARASALQVWQLWWGLTWWTWPLVALVVAAAVRARPRERDEMLVIDGAARLKRNWIALTEVKPAIALGVGLALLSTLTGFAAFDLASTSLPIAETYGSVLRRIRFEVGPDASMIASLPLILTSMIIAGAVAVLSRRSTLDAEAGAAANRRTSHVLVGLALAISIALPVGIMVQRLGGLEPFARLGPLEGRAIGESVSWAIAAGLLLALLAVGHSYGWSHHVKSVRRLTTLSAAGWVVMGVMPAAARGAALLQSHAVASKWLGAGAYPETLWLTLPGGAYLAWPVVVIVGYLASYGIVGMLIAWWIARGEDEALRGARLLDGAVGLRDWLAARGWSVVAAAGIAGLLGMALSLGEVSTTMIVLPPGPQSLTQRLLNKMHYAYEDSALATCLMILAIVVPAGFVAAMWLSRLRRSVRATAPLLVLALSSAMVIGMGGCEKPKSLDEGPFEPLMIIGSTGRSPGQFVYPRGMAFDALHKYLYVVDKTGRIQRFDEQGKFVDAIVLPKFDRGFPTGLSVQPDTGKLFVADTHEHRVLVYDTDGRLERTFGSEGEEPGQMLYPTDIAFGPGGVMFVSEYGGNDRIQAFDADGKPLYLFGEFGFGDGQFNRPQSVEYDQQRNELVILDACNHRVVVTDLKGNWKFTVGQPGRGPGELNYPYGLVLQPDGTFLISEFGNSRVQHLGRDGRCLGIWGTLGAEPGYLQTPWGLAADGRRVYVVDGSNNRVQVMARP